jgi:hypothetical protein
VKATEIFFVVPEPVHADSKWQHLLKDAATVVAEKIGIHLRVDVHARANGSNEPSQNWSVVISDNISTYPIEIPKEITGHHFQYQEAVDNIIGLIEPPIRSLVRLSEKRGSRGAAAESGDAAPTPELPDLPSQGPGPHFELTRGGVIDFAPPGSVDREGNNVARLLRLHPTLCELVRDVTNNLRVGNVPHAYLATRLDAYRNQIDRKLSEIDFSLLYVEGLRLANAESAAIEKIAEGELPSLSERDTEAIKSILQLHGTFVLATTSGMELIAAEQRYQRRPAEEREYREAAVDFAACLENRPDIMRPAAATFVRETAGEIGEGSNPDRSSAVATGTILNLTITLTAAAAVTAFPVVGGVLAGPPGAIAGGLVGLMASESLKKSKPFASVIAPIIRKLDQSATIDFHKFRKLLLEAEPKLRLLEKYSNHFLWVPTVLNWIKSQNWRAA